LLLALALANLRRHPAFIFPSSTFQFPFSTHVFRPARPCLVGRGFSRDIIAPPHSLSFRTKQADACSSRIAPAMRSACAVRNLSSLLLTPIFSARVLILAVCARVGKLPFLFLPRT